ncbi:MAG: 4-vinyl reductase, partial [Candidatus Micrarchaeota archaeon]
LCKQVPQRGYGNIEILEYDEKKPYILLRVFNSSNAEGMKTEWPVCYDLAGMFAGAAEVVFDKEMYCMETKCIAKGDEFCEFEVYPVK